MSGVLSGVRGFSAGGLTPDTQVAVLYLGRKKLSIYRRIYPSERDRRLIGVKASSPVRPSGVSDGSLPSSALNRSPPAVRS